MATKKKRRIKRRKLVAYTVTVFLVVLILILIFQLFFHKENSVPAGEQNHDEKPPVSDGETPKEEPTPEPPVVTDTYGKYLNKKFGVTVDAEMEQVLLHFMDLYYQSLKELKAYDMMSLFADSAYEEAYLNQTVTSMIVESRKLKTNDLSLSDAKYDILYESSTTKNGVTTIKFLENSHLTFRFMETESKIYDIENTIQLKKGKNGYQIVGFNREQDGFVMFSNEYNKTPTASHDSIKNRLDAMKSEYLEVTKQKTQEWEQYRSNYLAGKDKVSSQCDNFYDRDAALDYAKNYVTKRNPDWVKFDDEGGNCQNYASQMMYTGGIPMDTTGAEQWKYYGLSMDTSNAKKGRSASWAHVGSFYNYAKNNTGFGLCSKVDANPFYAEAGDIGQVGYAGMWNHTVVVVGTTTDKNGKVTDVLLNSNTVNLENFPLTAYVYPKSRIIKILGWNN